ncbi:hypothetical protein [Desulfoluna sp.]|uniref:hypothetical protein n=1 Tax=Desulfoluna sp. TaxID=2045199 RepID=UPI00261228AD|nr:hypothetical protein [Desulfoluna sp.]
MSIWRKIDQNFGKIIFSCIIWMMSSGILLKIYNGIYYPITYHGSLSNMWKAPLFSFRYVQDYWSNTLNIFLFTIGFIPPAIGYFLVSYSSRVVERENDKIRDRQIDEHLNGIKTKNKEKTKLPRNQKKKKRSKKNR